MLKEPENETRKISEFLNINISRPFELKKTKEHNFDSRDREKILSSTSDSVSKLARIGCAFDL
jgi:hypothetical protein